MPVLAELNRILTSGSFRAANRGRKLLQYVVEEPLAGRANRIKAYSIATIAFGRDPSFDPQSDPIVRIEAGHVRRALGGTISRKATMTRFASRYQQVDTCQPFRKDVRKKAEPDSKWK